nr:MAG TPA: hypothetical protein [Bacteriophage sp.]
MVKKAKTHWDLMSHYPIDAPVLRNKEHKRPKVL